MTPTPEAEISPYVSIATKCSGWLATSTMLGSTRLTLHRLKQAITADQTLTVRT